MDVRNRHKFVSAVFITFSGNCRQALTYYQTCFGGTVQFDAFDKKLQGYADTPIISGSLISDSIIIHGSDLVYSEGRILGNYLSIFMQCKTINQRQRLIEKLNLDKKSTVGEEVDLKLIEVTDLFDVRWILGV